MMNFDITTGETVFHDRCLCSFGIIEGIVAAVAAASASVAAGTTAAAVGAGIGATTAGAIGSVVGPALVYGGIGAATGALGSAVTGGDVGMGALGGALTGGIGGGLAGAGAGSALSGALGGVISPGVATGLLGAGVGALSSSVTGGDPLMGAVTGGVTGYAAGSLSPGDSFGNIPNGMSGLQVSPQGSLGASGGVEAGTWDVPDPSGVTGSNAAVSSGNPASGTTGALNAQSAQAASAAAPSSSGKGLLSNPSVILGALSALSSIMNKPQQGTYATPGPSSNAANLGPLYNTPLNTNVPGRTATTPTVPNWYTYGQIPGGATYFQGNSLKNFGFAKGGALSDVANQNEFMTDPGGSNHVRGPGGPEDDLIPAALSNGEYVLTSKEVSGIGRNSNDRGARKLDRLRKTGALSQILSRAEAA